MTRNGWIIFITIAIVIFGGLIVLSSRNAVDVSSIDEKKVQPATDASGNIADHSMGSTDNKVTLIEYGDYQCPGCSSAYEPLKTVSEKYKDQLTFVFRNFPLTSIHPNARAAAAAAETAGLMGKYWEMHDLLYANQTKWQNASTNERTDQFADFAAQIGLDRSKFIKTLKDKSEQINNKISFDQALGKKLGVSGTPAIYLNGKQIDQYVKDGKIVSSNTEGANPVWSSAESLDTLVIRPALEKAGYKNLPAAKE
jgi:protein-disulfide isomerase